MMRKLVFPLIFCVLLLFNNQAFSMGEKPPSPSESAPEVKVSEPVEHSGKVEQKKALTVYITKTGSKYHREWCSYLRQSSIPVDLNKAIEVGYTPCSRCKPPVVGGLLKHEAKTKQIDEKEEIVYITKTGKKYHRAGCRYLRRSSIPISLKKAKEYYSPCSVCW
ncbi:hypothetical protein ACFL4J_00705 [Candidatus Margulisiibacteriota bacterium]